MNYGMGQNFNSHTVRVGGIKEPNRVCVDDDILIEEQCKLYTNEKVLGLSFSVGLCNRKIKLIKILGKSEYNKFINKVKTLSR